MGNLRTGSRSRRRVGIVVNGLVIGVLLAACCPPGPPPPTPEPAGNIFEMTDAQVDEVLQDMAPEILERQDELLAQVPREAAEYVRLLFADLQTPTGRARITADLREAALTYTGGFDPRPEFVTGGVVGSTTGTFAPPDPPPPISGVRDANPPTTGARVEVGDGIGVCRSNGGDGDLAAPANAESGQLLTPHHNVFTTAGSAGNFGLLTPAGVDPVAGGGPGIELGSPGRQQLMRVQIHIEDPKDWGPLKVYPIFKIRPLGGTAAQEYQVQPVDGDTYCYEGDPEGSTRGYFDGWVPVPTTEPGFQLMVEVVENDFYFRPFGPQFDLLLSQPGPQFFAGGDRATVHVGATPVTTAQPISHGVGAFATAAKDPTGTPNLLTDTNGIPSDDVERPIAAMLETEVNSAVSDGLSGFLAKYYAANVVGLPTSAPQTDVDLRWVEPHTAFPDIDDEPAGSVGAIEANIHTEVRDIKIFAHLLVIPCVGIEGQIRFHAKVNFWADPAGNGTGITPRARHTIDPWATYTMFPLEFFNPVCALLWAVLPGRTEKTIRSDFTAAIDKQVGPDGSIGKLLRGFELNEYLPTVEIEPITVGNTSTGGAVVRPVVTNIDNGWCRAAGAPAGCSVNQSLLGRNGVEVTADTSLVASLSQALGGAFGGRFRNVYAPTLSATADDLVVSHRDAVGATAGLGVVIDPSLVNVALRHLAQGTTTGTTTNGLLDIRGFTLPVNGFSATIRPEVAPLVTGVPQGQYVCGPPFCAAGPQNPPSRTTAKAVIPDGRVDIFTSEGQTDPIRYSVSVSDDIGVAYDAATGRLRPTFSPAIFDIQVVSGCQADYDLAYATSYLFCGRGNGGNGREDITTLNDLIDRVAHLVVMPLVENSVGDIGLPSLDGVLPGMKLTLANVRFAQRGGYLTVYADGRAQPRIELRGSTAGYGGEDDTIRFFIVPTNLDLTAPTSYSWTIRDGVTGLPVTYTSVAGANGSAVQFPSSAFTPEPVDGRPTKKVQGSVTVNQVGLTVTASGTYSWALPEPPHPPNCPPGLPGGPGGPGPGFILGGAGGIDPPGVSANLVGC